MENRLATPMNKRVQTGRLLSAQYFFGACCLVAIISVAGCNSRFPESRVFQNINLTTLFSVDEYKPNKQPTSSSITVLPEYATENCKLTLVLSNDKTKEYLSRVMAECTNRVVQLGGLITGEGKTSNSDMQELMYKTDKTRGQISVWSTSVNETNLEVLVMIFECRRR